MSSGGRAPASYLARRTLRPVSGSFSAINMRGCAIEPGCAKVALPSIRKQKAKRDNRIRLRIFSSRKGAKARKDAKKTPEYAAALCVFAALREKYFFCHLRAPARYFSHSFA